MKRPPRAPDAPVFPRDLWFRMAFVGLFLLAAAYLSFQWELARGMSVAQARTVAVNVFVFTELLYLLSCRSLRAPSWRRPLTQNPYLILGVVASVGMQMAFTYLAVFQAVFQSGPTDLRGWSLPIGAAVLCHFLVEGFKHLHRIRSHKGPSPTLLGPGPR